VAQHDNVKRMVVGISGATGAQIAIDLLTKMQHQPGWETHLVISDGARRTIELETTSSYKQIQALATRCYPIDDVGAHIASGTFKTEGMVVVPCSMKTLAGIATGLSLNLLLRAADVHLKERRKLILVARESPLNLVHLNNMVAVTNMGAMVCPPVLTFYNHPASIQDMTNHVVGKIMDVFGLEADGFRRWNHVHQPELAHV
jgi:flavin prenyltransferase